MLKLNYTDLGLYMEWVMTSPEMVIAQRVALAMRFAQPLHVEPGHAGFLLPTQIAELRQLDAVLQEDARRTTNILPVDEQFVEVNLSGSWIAASREAHEGMFITAMSDRAESLIYRLWHMSEAPVSSWA
ncbi:MAG: alr0857 family protein [Cyanobacteria bacterium J06638_28]